jgi:hypothetical protein
MSNNKDTNKTKNTIPTELSDVKTLSGTSSPESPGCTTSFLTRKKNESDKVCGTAQTGSKEEYVQKDEEKESGGEA